MPNEEGRRTDDVRMVIKTLALRAPGSSAGVARAAGQGSTGVFTRLAALDQLHRAGPRAFDSIRWRLIKEDLRKRGASH